MNLFEYVEKYGNYTFLEEPFNEVDNVIFSQMPYLPLKGIVSGFGHRAVTVDKVVKRLKKPMKNLPKGITGRLYKKIQELLIIMSTTRRYKDIKFYNYVNIIEQDKQFGAVTIKLPDNSIYISFEGTDSSISGWYEDACMTYLYPIPAQELAANYLRRTIKLLDKNVRVGGHSKGGNLAVYACLEAPFYLKNKIVKIYNNDGPGFFKELYDTKKYQNLSSKIQKIVPNESVVGMFLYHGEELTIVKSKSKRILQHDPFNWQVNENMFQYADLSSFSKNVSLKTNEWLEKLEKDKRKECFENLFKAFTSSDIEATYELYSFSKTKNFIKNLYHIDTETKQNLMSVVKEVIW